MRVLLTSTAGQGHAHPLVPFARAAQAAGAEVRLAVPPDGIAGVERLGIPLVPTAQPAPEVAGPFWAALPGDPDQANDHVVAGWFAGHVARAALPAVHAEVEEWRPDLVISESGEFAGALCAEAAGVHHLTVGVTSLADTLFGAARLVEEVNASRRLVGLPEVAEVPWRRSTTTYVTAVPRVLWGRPDEVPRGTLLVRHEDPEGPVPTAGRGRRPGAGRGGGPR